MSWDWLDGEESLAAALDPVANAAGGHVEVAECERAIAAAEVVAALLGVPADELPDEARAWVERHGSLEDMSLVDEARAAVHRVIAQTELEQDPQPEPPLADLRRRLENISAA